MLTIKSIFVDLYVKKCSRALVKFLPPSPLYCRKKRGKKKKKKEEGREEGKVQKGRRGREGGSREGEKTGRGKVREKEREEGGQKTSYWPLPSAGF